MDLQIISGLMAMFQQSGLSALEVEQDGLRVRFENSGAAAVPAAPMAMPPETPSMIVMR